MNKLTLPSIAGISLLISSLIAVPVQASIITEENTETRETISLSEEMNAGNSNQYVLNTNSHVNTGVSVNTGDVIKIQASGIIRFGFFTGSGGPRGIIFNPEYNYFIDVPHGQLMVRVRQFGMQDL